MSELHDDAPNAQSRSAFEATHWSMVLRAGRRADHEADAALAELCQRYWYPLYAYVRRHVSDVHEAQDLTQEFFAWLLEKNTLAAATPERGRFRAFLLTVLKNFLANQRDRSRAQKRGGGTRPLQLDFQKGESRLRRTPSHELTPERLYQRQWALTLLKLTYQRLEKEYQSAGRSQQFQRLKGALGGDHQRLPNAALGAALGISEEGARQAASRLRRRYRELLREEISQTVADPRNIDEEIAELFAILQT